MAFVSHAEGVEPENPVSIVMLEAAAILRDAPRHTASDTEAANWAGLCAVVADALTSRAIAYMASNARKGGTGKSSYTYAIQDAERGLCLVDGAAGVAEYLGRSPSGVSVSLAKRGGKLDTSRPAAYGAEPILVYVRRLTDAQAAAMRAALEAGEEPELPREPKVRVGKRRLTPQQVAGMQARRTQEREDLAALARGEEMAQSLHNASDVPETEKARTTRKRQTPE